MLEGFLKNCTNIISLTSDFWHHPIWKTAFGACIKNFIANGYYMNTGEFLAISDTTLAKMKQDGIVNDMLKSATPKFHRVQGLLDFCQFDMPKTGDNIGKWQADCHTQVGCKPSYISSHTIDGAGNAGALAKLYITIRKFNNFKPASGRIEHCQARKI
mmetsp:Transcript_18661/g.30159  ORF Transcript_18661/g.30159 Transcript_18661/m.30159 type:complete len:158 (+) Transcript_18661:246-719(+)